MIEFVAATIARVAVVIVWRGLQLAAWPLVTATAIGGAVIALRVPAIRSAATDAAVEVAQTTAIALAITLAVIAVGSAIAHIVVAAEQERRARRLADARALVANDRAARAARAALPSPAPSPADVVDLDAATAIDPAPVPALAGSAAAVVPFAARPTDRRFAR